LKPPAIAPAAAVWLRISVVPLFQLIDPVRVALLAEDV
jgi:hypothetical protein